jgi:hypothetical protein
MQTMLPGHTVSDKDTYERFLSRKGPAVVADFLDGSGDFARHLRRLTPMGAPALRCWADWEPEPCPLPLVEPLDAPGADAHEEFDWMVRALRRIQYRRKPLQEIEKTAQFLAPGPRRPMDELPAWWSDLEPAWTGNWQPRGPQRDGQRTGRARRDILAAVCADIHGRPLTWVSGTVLGLSDHEEFTKDGKITKEPRKARLYRDRGRAILAALGAWPWTLASHGKLARRWREDRAYMFSLECWAARAADDLRAKINKTGRSLSALSRAGGDRASLHEALGT